MRLRTRREYQRISRSSKRAVAKYIIVDYQSNGKSLTRLGMTVTKKFGKAHQRGRFKRIVREAFRLSHSHLVVGLDLNVKPRSLASEAAMQDIQADLFTLFGATNNDASSRS